MQKDIPERRYTNRLNCTALRGFQKLHTSPLSRRSEVLYSWSPGLSPGRQTSLAPRRGSCVEDDRPPWLRPHTPNPFHANPSGRAWAHPVLSRPPPIPLLPSPILPRPILSPQPE